MCLCSNPLCSGLTNFGEFGKLAGFGKPEQSAKGTLWQISNGTQTVENDRAKSPDAKRTKQYAQSCLSMCQDTNNAFVEWHTNEQPTKQRRKQYG